VNDATPDAHSVRLVNPTGRARDTDVQTSLAG
jgi:hypothetical protein